MCHLITIQSSLSTITGRAIVTTERKSVGDDLEVDLVYPDVRLLIPFPIVSMVKLVLGYTCCNTMYFYCLRVNERRARIRGGR